MIYAAAAAYMGDFAAELEPTLRRLEDEAAKEAVRSRGPTRSLADLA